MDIRLSPRLEAILSAYGAVDTAADVGCDHGYLSAALLMRGLASRVTASDISPLCLKKTERLAARLGFGDRLSIAESDGLGHLSPNDADIVYIAGMGGLTIAGILERRPEVAQAAVLVLQPQGTIPELRRFLRENGYGTETERLAVENERHYHILTVRHGAKTPSITGWPEGDRLLSPALASDPLLSDYIARLASRAESRLSTARAAGASANELSEFAEYLHTVQMITGR